MQIQTEDQISSSDVSGTGEHELRVRIEELGGMLVEATKTVTQVSRRFLALFNRNMEHVRIDRFIFEEADYETVAVKEVREIREIFKAFGIRIEAHI